MASAQQRLADLRREKNQMRRIELPRLKAGEVESWVISVELENPTLASIRITQGNTEISGEANFTWPRSTR